MFLSLFNSPKKQKGQGLVEYALILVLVAIVVIAAAMMLGPQIGNIFSTINSSMGTLGSGTGGSSGGGSNLPLGASCKRSSQCQSGWCDIGSKTCE